MQQTLALVLALVLGVQTQLPDSVVERRTKALASQLRCPVCQGLSIQDSPSPIAQKMRDAIAGQIRAGKTDEEVTDYFVEKYDEWILLEPKASGFNLAVYLLPVVMLVGGVGLVVYLARKWSRGAAPVVPDEEAEENSGHGQGHAYGSRQGTV